MYSLFKYLFGFDYVAVEFGGYDCVRRVRYLPDGRAYVILYGNYEILLETKRRVIYLTCLKNQLNNEAT